MKLDGFEMPDMEDMARQMEEAMQAAQEAMDDLPGQMAQMQDVMGDLSSMMGDLPDQMQELSGAMEGFGEQHQQNAAALIGEPDWGVRMDIRVGSVLRVQVIAAFDLQKVIQTWQSTHDGGFGDMLSGLVAGVAGEDMDEGTLEQVVGQLQKGRGMAAVKKIDVLECHIAGAPANATTELQLSPEANIPLELNEDRLCFELAPLLTIRNQWEHAAVPAFEPMAAGLRVPLRDFEGERPFRKQFSVSTEAHDLVIDMEFASLP